MHAPCPEPQGCCDDHTQSVHHLTTLSAVYADRQEHLHRRGHIAAMRALEKEAGVEAEPLSENASFFRALVLDGRWDDAITMLEVQSASRVVDSSTPLHETEGVLLGFLLQ